MTPQFSRKICSLDPILETQVAHTHKKKLSAPLPENKQACNNYYMFCTWSEYNLIKLYHKKQL